VLATGNDLQNARDLHGQASLLQTLPGRGESRVLAGVHKASGEGPQSTAGLVGTPDEQYGPVPLHQHGGGDLGVGKMDPATGGADRALLTKAWLTDEGRCATRAVAELGHCFLENVAGSLLLVASGMVSHWDSIKERDRLTGACRSP
jgi:hypothetical protein